MTLQLAQIEPNGRIQCGYHGWEFGESGACARIPQLGKGLTENSTAVINSDLLNSAPPRKLASASLLRVKNLELRTRTLCTRP